MKKILILSVLLLTILFSCNNDDYIAPYGDYSNFLWTTTSGAEETDYVIALNDFIGFFNVSNNELSHNWSIPAGTSILNTEFTENDSIYTEFVIGSGPSSIQEKQLNVLFNTPGVKEIKLRNTFKDSVTDSEFKDGLWEVNKTFTVTVFDDIRPSFKVMRGDEELINVTKNEWPSDDNSASWPIVTIEAGEELTFVDMTTDGEPDKRTWTFNGAKIESSGSETAKVSYFGLGTSKAGSIKSVRNQSEEKPKGEATKLIPLNIEVVKSSKPFEVFGKVSLDKDETISFSVTGEINEIGNQLDKFKVNVVNTASGFNQEIAVASVSIDPSDPTVLNMKLSDPVYNSDVVSISYEGGAVEEERISSVDERYLEDFTDLIVDMYFEGSMNLDFTGYELPWDGNGNQWREANAGGYFGQHNGKTEAGPLYYWRDTTVKRFGVSSMKFETSDDGLVLANTRLQGSKFSTLSPITAGKYVPSLWIYLDEGNTMNNIEYNFTTGPALIFDLSTIDKGKWVQLTLPEADFGDISKGRLDINIKKAGQDDAQVQKLWLDNFDLLIVEERI